MQASRSHRFRGGCPKLGGRAGAAIVDDGVGSNLQRWQHRLCFGVCDQRDRPFFTQGIAGTSQITASGASLPSINAFGFPKRIHSHQLRRRHHAAQS
jgi:hypothetical protein